MNNIPSISIELQRTFAALLVAMATEKKIRPIVTAYQTEILAEMQELSVYDLTPITEPKQAWTMPDNRFVVYCEKTAAAAKKAGFDVPDECCPLLMADEATRKAQRAFVDAAFYLTKLTTDDILCSADGLENYKKMTAALLGAVATAPKKKLDKLAVAVTTNSVWEMEVGKEFSVRKRYWRNTETKAWGHWVGQPFKLVEVPDILLEYPTGKK